LIENDPLNNEDREMAVARLAVTMGDPAGIGPEIIAKAIARLRPRLDNGALALLVVGSVAAMRTMAHLSGPLPEVGDDIAAGGALPSAAILEAGSEREPIRAGVISAEGGRLAYLAIDKALARAGAVAGIVTAPLNKEALNKAGYAYAGHTDMLADLTTSR
jgi:4-hydroxythreonine-4-phosphate dehydrogenase